MALALRSEDWLDEDLPGDDELPCSDGVPMDDSRHPLQNYVLMESLRVGWAHRTDFYVGSNMFMYFSPKQIKKNDFRGPDLFVVLDTKRQGHRHSWVVWKERRTPSLIIELVSESTERVDRGEKFTIYARDLHVDDYFLYDTTTGALEGYHLDPETQRYLRLLPGPQGRIWSPALELWLGPVLTDWDNGSDTFHMLRWFDASGRMLPTEGERAQQELDRARDELEAERQKAEAERQKAEAERQKAEAELIARQRAELRIRELEALLASSKRGVGDEGERS